MVRFNELYMLPWGKMIRMAVQVEELEAYEDMYIDTILMDTADTYREEGPSDKAILVFQSGEEDNLKRFTASVDVADLKSDLYFIYVICKGTLKENAPCGVKVRMVTGVVYDKYALYRLSVGLLHSLKHCELPNDLINYVLALKAFELAIKSGEFKIAIEYWNKFFANKKHGTITSCGCHG